jgi:hypothetical protein
MRLALAVMTIFLTALIAFGYPSNPPLGYAGQPPSGNNCINCHTGNQLNAPGGTLTISGLPVGGYVPGATYHLTVTQARSGMTRWGFELTAIYQSGTNYLQAGNLIVTDATHTNLGVGTGTAPDYMRQTSSGSYSGSPGPISWNFDWSAPNPAVGPIGIYASGAACNNTGGTGGDWCYTTSTTVNPLTTPPALDVTLTPNNPPIVIPAQGGSFSFNLSVMNGGPAMPYAVWARIQNPDGSYSNPTLGPVTINTPVGVTVTRTRNQNIPGTWAAGQYTSLGYANTSYAYPAIDSSSFTWTKTATTDGDSPVWDAVCAGELFPGEVPVAAPASIALICANPNPFNPSTTISFTLPEALHVTLNVYDASGRQVAQLVNGLRQAGQQQVIFDGSKLASGMYLYSLAAGRHTAAGKMLLLK